MKKSYQRCFACDRPLGLEELEVYTSDGQRVRVGMECFRKVKKWNSKGGYQPPLGGPKLTLSHPDPQKN